jgi:ankyrin repeat protein
VAFAPNAQEGATAINAAAYNGHLEVVRLLLGRGADPDLEVKRRRPPARPPAHAFTRGIGAQTAAQGSRARAPAGGP